MTPEEVWPHLERMVERYAGSGALAAFDWDDTCAQGDIGLNVLRTLDSEDGGERLAEYERLCALDKEVGYPWCTAVHAGQTLEAQRALGRRVWSAATADGRIRLRPWIGRLMRTMRSRGWEVWVVSANPKAFVEIGAAEHGVPPDHVIAMELEADADGLLTDTLRMPAPYLAHKVTTLRHYTGRTPTFAASDSISDLALLESASHALALPAWPDGLRAAADERGYWVVDDV